MKDGAVNIDLEVGRHAEVKNNVKGSETVYKEHLKMDAHQTENRETQGSIEIAKHPLKYSLDYGYFESLKFYYSQQFVSYSTNNI